MIIIECNHHRGATATHIFLTSKNKKTMKNFKQYHKENAHIWEAFKKYSFEAKRRGFKNYSAYSIFEVIRWETGIFAEDGEYKLNNNFRPDYARKMMAEFTDFEGFFRVRELKAKRT